jgi:hypothetical protein
MPKDNGPAPGPNPAQGNPPGGPKDNGPAPGPNPAQGNPPGGPKDNGPSPIASSAPGNLPGQKDNGPVPAAAPSAGKGTVDPVTSEHLERDPENPDLINYDALSFDQKYMLLSVEMSATYITSHPIHKNKNFYKDYNRFLDLNRCSLKSNDDFEQYARKYAKM